MYDFSRFREEGLHIETTELIKEIIVIVDPLPKHFRVRIYKGEPGYFAYPEKLFISPKKKKNKNLPYHGLEKYPTIEGALFDAISRALHYYDKSEYDDTEIVYFDGWKIPYIQPDLTWE